MKFVFSLTHRKKALKIYPNFILAWSNMCKDQVIEIVRLSFSLFFTI